MTREWEQFWRRLSPAQRVVLRELARGAEPKSLAGSLGITPRGVYWHCRQIALKGNAATCQEVLLSAVRAGVV